MEMTRKIYDFIGHDIPQDIVDLINQRKRKRRSDISKLEEMNMFGVNKRKNETSIFQLRLINEEQAQQINDLCRQYLDLFEYQ